MSTDKASIGPRSVVSFVRHSRRECAVTTSPVIIRNKVEVVVERRLRLLPNDLEDGVDGAEPVRVHER